VLLLGTHWAGFSSAIPLGGFGLVFVAFGVVSWYSSQGNEFSVNDGGVHGIKKDDQNTVTRPATAFRSEDTKILGWDGRFAVSHGKARDEWVVSGPAGGQSGRHGEGRPRIQLEFQRMSCQPTLNQWRGGILFSMLVPELTSGQGNLE
jgi:hypothetical protein